MARDTAFISHMCISCGKMFVFVCTKVKVICKFQGQISRSHLKKKNGCLGDIGVSSTDCFYQNCHLQTHSVWKSPRFDISKTDF